MHTSIPHHQPQHPRLTTPSLSFRLLRLLFFLSQSLPLASPSSHAPLGRLALRYCIRAIHLPAMPATPSARPTYSVPISYFPEPRARPPICLRSTPASIPVTVLNTRWTGYLWPEVAEGCS